MPLGCRVYVTGWGKGYIMCPIGSTTITLINQKSFNYLGKLKCCLKVIAYSGGRETFRQNESVLLSITV